MCQWLDLVGLGSFKQAFKERKVDGYMLLHMDVQLFGEEVLDIHILDQSCVLACMQLSLELTVTK